MDYADVWAGIQKIVEIVEDIWIEKEFYRKMLAATGLEPDPQLLRDALRSDSALRKDARQHFSQMHQNLRKQAEAVALDSVLEIDKTRKPS